MDKCCGCLHSRPIISENGIRPICCLSSKKAMLCITGKKDYSARIKREEESNQVVVEDKQ